VKKIAFLLCCLIAVLPAGAPAATPEAPQSVFAKAQFPEPVTVETEREWKQFNLAYMRRYIPNLRAPEPEPMATPAFAIAGGVLLPPTPVYSEFDREGRPLWWGGERDFELRNLVQTLLANDPFDALDRLVDDWTKNAERTADGKWKLVQFKDQLDNAFAWRNGWETEFERIQRWKAHRPKSVGAAIAEAEYWRTYAWHVRISGYANTVDEDGWRLFQERSQKAEESLLASKDYAGDNPLWGDIYLDLTAGLQWPLRRQLALYRELIAKNKYYYHHYFGMINYASPKWGGDWDLVEKLAREAEASTSDVEGATLYARIYWSAARSHPDRDLFRESRLDWAHMKQGLEDMIARYPHSAERERARLFRLRRRRWRDLPRRALSHGRSCGNGRLAAQSPSGRLRK
jgi:hypothetical protein